MSNDDAGGGWPLETAVEFENDVQSDVVALEPSPAAPDASPDTSVAQEAIESVQGPQDAPGGLTEALPADESETTSDELVDQSSDEADAQPQDAQPDEGPVPEADEAPASPLDSGIPAWHAEALAFGRVGAKPDVQEEFRQALIGRGIRP